MLSSNKIHVQSNKQKNGQELLETSEIFNKEPNMGDNTLSQIENLQKYHQVKRNNKQISVLYKGVNQILTTIKNRELVFYIPAYLRITINRVSRIDYLGCRASIDANFRLWIMVDGLSPYIQQQILEECQFCINGQQNFKLKDIIEKKKNTHLVQNTSKKVQQFFIRKNIDLDIETDVWLSPFQLIKIKGSIDLKGTTFKPQKESQEVQQVHLQFNFMESHPFIQFSFNELRNLGNFQLAESMIGIDFNNEKYFGKMKFSVDKSGDLIQLLTPFVNPLEEKENHLEAQKNESPSAFSHGQIGICMYKYPFSVFASIFIPFYLLTIVSFGIFFQANDMNGRAISISMLLMAYFSFLPSIRSRLPPVSTFILTEFLIYVQTICMILYFVQSISIKDIPDYQFIWYKDIFFIIIMSISILNALTVIVISILHKCKWEPMYNRLPDGTQELFEITEIDTNNWHNKKCEQQFKDLIKDEELKIFKPTYFTTDAIKRLSALESRESKKIIFKLEDLKKHHVKVI